MASIDVRDPWAVVNTATGEIIETHSNRNRAERFAAGLNTHETENDRPAVYGIALHYGCERFADLLNVAKEKGVFLSPLFSPIKL